MRQNEKGCGGGVQGGWINRSEELRTAMIEDREIGLGRQPITAILLYQTVALKEQNPEELVELFGPDTATIVQGLLKSTSLYNRRGAMESENFRNLLLTFAQDVRVIMIMIVERLDTMRSLQGSDAETQQLIAREASFLYAPLAHRSGLYAIKTGLVDLSLNCTSREIYKEIAHKLNDNRHPR